MDDATLTLSPPSPLPDARLSPPEPLCPISGRSPAPWRQGLAAAKANIVPGLALTVIGVAILAGYYSHPPTHAILERVAAAKRQGGLLFSLVSTAFFGGLVPVLLQQLVPGLPRRERLAHLPFFLLFWGYRGVETDLFYRLQVWLFGDSAAPGVVMAKLAVDMLLYTTLWAVPMTVLAYRWKDSGFVRPGSFSTVRTCGRQWYRHRVVPVLIANNAIWLPAVAILYCLPLALQMPFQNLVLCLSTLIITLVIATHPSAEASS